MEPFRKPRPRLLALAAGLTAGFVPWLLAQEPLFPLILLTGLTTGVVTSSVARTYYSGNPALAYCLALLAARPQLDPFYQPVLALVILAGLLVCITACWAIDVYVNFPKLERRPPPKRVEWRRIVPGTLGLAAATAVPLAYPILAPAVIALTRLPGSLWAGIGPLLGLMFAAPVDPRLIPLAMAIPIAFQAVFRRAR